MSQAWTYKTISSQADNQCSETWSDADAWHSVKSDNVQMKNETVDVPNVALENSEEILDEELQNIVPASDRVLRDRD